nr:MAG TPA_asm: hypothetical protein [Caudoviricetes sp.]
MPNPDVSMTLEEAVAEVLSTLTGMDLDYDPNQDRFRVVVRALNRAQRAIALEHEWSYYSSLEEVGYANKGEREVPLRANIRPRIISDDSVRLVDSKGHVRVWAYFLPRDAIHKYEAREGLWVSATRSTLYFSRPFYARENGMMIQVPVMREPRKLVFPEISRNPSVPVQPVPEEILQQQIDFDYPDLIVARAAHIVATSDPVMQPRVQDLEAGWKTIMYALTERDDRATDAPFVNEFILPISSSIYADAPAWTHAHPHSDSGRQYG